MRAELRKYPMGVCVLSDLIVTRSSAGSTTRGRVMSGASTHEHEGHGHEGHGHEGHGHEADGHGGEANGSFDTELNSLEYESVRHDGHIHESHQTPRAGRELWATAVSATLH